jgi:hypothetical protein
VDPEEWEKHWAEFEARMAKIDAIYKWKIHVIARHRRQTTFFLTGYIVLLVTGIVTMEWRVMMVGMLCALGVLVSMLWMAWQLHTHPYPDQKR